jgi:hypothetical protein
VSCDGDVNERPWTSEERVYAALTQDPAAAFTVLSARMGYVPVGTDSDDVNWTTATIVDNGTATVRAFITVGPTGSGASIEVAGPGWFERWVEWSVSGEGPVQRKLTPHDQLT